jgi:hypothetical protein
MQTSIYNNKKIDSKRDKGGVSLFWRKKVFCTVLGVDQFFGVIDHDTHGARHTGREKNRNSEQQEGDRQPAEKNRQKLTDRAPFVLVIRTTKQLEFFHALYS